MKPAPIEQVLLVAHGWGYNHRFFDLFLNALPPHIQQTTLFVCLEAGYFPEQAQAGLMIHTHNEWVHQPTEALHSLVLAHAEVPWLGLGHSLGFSKLLEFSVRWHGLFSLHGFTYFTRSETGKVGNAGNAGTAGTSPRVLARMIQQAEQNMADVLGNFHLRCGHLPKWTTLNEQALLADLQSMQSLNAANALEKALLQGADLYAWAGQLDAIVPPELALACFDEALSRQGRILHTPPAEHASFASQPALYTNELLPLLGRR